MTRATIAVLCVWLSGCCMGGTPAPMPPPPGLSPTPMVPPTVAPAPAGLTTITAGPGMAPDPTLTAGLAGGPIPASTLSSSCYAGSFPVQPQVTLRVTGPMPMLVIVANGDNDLTLAVRRPDGSFACDDDGDVGLNPRVAEPGMAGDYSIYVGTFGTIPAPFTLGVSSIAAMAAPFLTEGAAIRHGHLRVVTSTLIPVGTLCDYLQVSHPPSVPNGVDVRWRVSCAGTVLYGNGAGEGDAGFSYLSLPAWSPGTLINDAETSGTDTDPSFVWDATGIRISDDVAGYSGAHVTTFVEAP